MSEEKKSSGLSKAMSKGSDWLESILAIGGGIALPIFAWSKRPLELRSLSDTAMAALQNDWVLKPEFFYGSFVVTVGLIVYGISKVKNDYD